MVLTAAFALPLAQADVEATNLPGGTSLTVSIDSPTDGQTFVIPPGETSIDVPVTGGASIGEGAPVADTTIVFVVDVSGSTGGSAGGASTCPDGNGDSVANTVLDCEIEGVVLAAQAGESEGTVDEFGMVTFATGAATQDMLAAAGVQPFTASALDVETVASGLVSSGLTNFEAAVQEACSLAASATNPNVLVLFLSDGQATDGGAPDDDVPCGTAVFQTFAVGGASSCGDPSGNFSLARIADETGGTCQEVTDPSDLADVIPAALGSTLDGLFMSLDGAGFASIVGDLTAGVIPAPGATAVTYATMLPGVGVGDHNVRVASTGDDAGGSGFALDLHNFTVLQGVFFDVKPGSCPNPLQTNSNGRLPVAIVGHGNLSVADIDVATVRLEGVAPVKDSIEDVATPYTGGFSDPLSETDCHTATADGIDDLALKFDRQDIVAALETNYGPLVDGQLVMVEITGDLVAGGSFVGHDVIRIND